MPRADDDPFDSDLEAAFWTTWRQLGGPLLVIHHPFHQWEIDFVHLETKTAIEVEGGTAGGRGRHSREPGFTKDARKYNAWQAEGGLVFRFSSRMVTEGGKDYDLVIRVIAERWETR